MAPVEVVLAGGTENRAEWALTFRVNSRSAEMQRQIERALHVAPTPYAVLIEGETGTGKELFARGIHAASRRPGPFVPINCSAVPESMCEAELFGARRGAYTGLDRDRFGLFQLADGGTLFLDEIGDLPASIQATLLRVLEDGVVRPLGGGASVRVDVRIVAATLRSLTSMVDGGAFRRDLYFRLSQECLRLPPLRDRLEDLSPLIDEVLRDACALQGVSPRSLAPDAHTCLLNYEWPGNIRELHNVLASAVLSSTGDVVGLADLPARVRGQHSDSSHGITVRSDAQFFDALQAFEREYMRTLLTRSEGNISEAARQSGLSRAAVRSKARQYGLAEGPVRATTRSRVRFPTEPPAIGDRS